MGSRAIRRLATNPLLCSVICALHRDTNEQLPEDRLELYERCCSMLLDRRDPEGGLTISDYPRLTYRQKRVLLDDLAYWMIKNEWTEISITTACDRLSKKIETLRTDARDGVVPNAQNVLALFIERSGMLRQPVEGKVDFAHRTFEEFMAANAAVGECDIGVLVSHAMNPQWKEVIVLGAGLARRGERADLIRSLLSKGDKDRQSRHQLHLLAAACLDTAVDLDADIKKEVETRIRNLVPPKRVSEGMLLAEAAGELAVPFLKRNRAMTSRQASACVRALALIGSFEAVQAIAEYAEDFSSLVLREIIRAADRVDVNLFLQFVAPRIKASRLPDDAVGHALWKFGTQGIPKVELAEAVALSGRKARDLSILKHLHRLHTVTLSDSDINDLTPLQQVLRLTSLSLRRTSVDISQLTELRTLRSLNIWDCSVTNQWAFQNLTQLERLTLFGCQLGELTPLVPLQNLIYLSLDGFTGDLSPIRSLANLQSLRIWSSTPLDLSWLDQLAGLQTLGLEYCRMIYISTLPMLPKLRHLDLTGSRLSSHQMRMLRQKCPDARVVIDRRMLEEENEPTP
jgi:hypothetical protein